MMPDPVYKKRLKWLALAVGFASLVVTARLVQLQVFRAEHFRELGTRQAQGTIEVDLPRAVLLDRSGIPLAASVRCPSLFTMDPDSVEDPEGLAREISALSGRSAGAILKDLEARKGFTWLARKVHFTQRIQAEQVCTRHRGVEMMEEPGRFYPQDTLASNLIGCMGTDGGLSGLEHQWDRQLGGGPRGKRKFLVTKDGKRKPTVLIPLEAVEDVDPQPTHVRLTLDAAIQYEAEKALGEAVDQYQATCGVCIVLDPKNGDLLAAAVRPTFDPNRPGNGPRPSWRNRSVTDCFEPGSTFKLVTVAAALESGRFKPEDTIPVGNGTLQVGPKLMHDDHPPHSSIYTIKDVITYSSNVGAARIGMSLGPTTLYHYIRLFGFGQMTALKMDAETTGKLRPPEKWSELSNASLSFGQEISVTPLQLCLAYAAVASRGYRVVPRILPEAPVPPAERILSPTTVAALDDMLASVVTAGTGKSAAVPGVTVAGKTGTAQKLGIVSPDGRRLFIAYFAGYAPVEDPRVVCLVMVDEPVGAKYGGAISAPVFSRVVSFALKRLRTTPSPLVLAVRGGRS
jgi:cell division protein FtsI (penicillin-binding protein 3)